MATHGRWCKLGSKPSWLYVSFISYPKVIAPLNLSNIILRMYLITYKYLSDIRYKIYKYIHICVCVCVCVCVCEYVCVCTHTHIYAYIYIYIYIYIWFVSEFLNEPEFICWHKVKWFQILQFYVCKLLNGFKYWSNKCPAYDTKLFEIELFICIKTGTLAQRLECSPMARETWVQSQVESYQRL